MKNMKWIICNMIMIMMMLPIYDYDDGGGGGGEFQPEASHSIIPNCHCILKNCV